MVDVQNLKTVTEKEASRFLGRAVQTLRNDRHMRKGCPYIKIGRSVRYRLLDIEDFLAKHRIDPEGSLN